MKRILTIAAISATLVLPAAAQEDNGQSLMEQGAELFFDGLRKEMEPALDDLLGLANEFGPAMQSFFAEMGPAIAELAGEIKDWSAYEAPEMLPNGDIIIRKKTPQDPSDDAEKTEEAPEGEIDI
ncbi:hypothetical protein HW561_01805 [Rhodobacteraceae bacterium B1Z28]|uniref:ATPases of the AAA+ class n=1 Tax=Ruegeria haliotis TaxID=2747601 RepID=A0ABX2PK74_9RHOB|nr:hypothetical protein [Ruegeria haliotis]NVO54523.1 hypothetical protein [Ruegeria haliotis]